MIARAIAVALIALTALTAWIAVVPVARAEPPDDSVALLPLDADHSLELYGQPVASEIARALGAGSVQVVVVGPRTAMPERARLIVDGTIALGKTGAVTIAIRIRSTVDGKVLDTLSAAAPGLAKLDGAAAEVSARLLPIVRSRLAALGGGDDHGRVSQMPRPPVARAATPAAVRVAVVNEPKVERTAGLTSALDAELGG